MSISRCVKVVGFFLGLTPACVGELGEDEGGRGVKAIINGTLDPGDDNVVALLDGGSPFCSGTLVAPRVVVTAAHCLLGRAGVAGLEVYFGPHPGGPAGRRIRVVGAKAHPAATEGSVRGVDVGVLALAEAAPFAPKRMNQRGFDGSFMQAGVRLVGYGTDDPHGGGMGPKRQAMTRVTSFTTADFDFGGTGTSACFGDSGGPAFMTIDGAEVLVGITSGGDDECTHGTYGRVDAHLDSFIRPFIAANGGEGDGTTPPAPGTGGCGSISYEGVCDGSVLSYCDEDGTFVSFACAGASGGACGCDGGGWCDCVASAPAPAPTTGGEYAGGSPPGDCGQVDYYGACQGDLLSWCHDGRLEVVDCAHLGALCDWQDDEVGYNCL